jgi:hypothetical protein
VPPAQRGESETQPLNNIEKKKGVSVSVTVPILSHGICQKPKTHPPFHLIYSLFICMVSFETDCLFITR